MGSEDSNGMDWKNIADSGKNESSATPTVKKRLPRKMRQIPDYYFLPKRSIFATIAIYGSCIVGGVGAGMLAEMWINKKIKEDGNGVIWEFDK